MSQVYDRAIEIAPSDKSELLFADIHEIEIGRHGPVTIEVAVREAAGGPVSLLLPEAAVLIPALNVTDLRPVTPRLLRPESA